jgi:hypothetical protein
LVCCASIHSNYNRCSIFLEESLGPPDPYLKLSKAANTRVFIVYNDREKLLFSPVLTFEQKFDILVFIVVYEVRRLVRKQELYAGPRNPNV